jgi:transposase
LPSRFPSYPTCWRRLKEWSESGIFKKAWARLLQLLDRQGNIDREESMADGTFSPAKKGGFV